MSKLSLVEFENGKFAYRKTWFGFIHKYLNVTNVSNFKDAMETSLITTLKKKNLYKITRNSFINSQNTKEHCKRIYTMYLESVERDKKWSENYISTRTVKKIHQNA